MIPKYLLIDIWRNGQYIHLLRTQNKDNATVQQIKESIHSIGRQCEIIVDSFGVALVKVF